MSARKTSSPDWRPETPIYLQILDLLIDGILDGSFAEGDLLPSVRQLAQDHDVSTITAAKVLKELDASGATVKRRGIGWQIKKGSRAKLVKQRQSDFLKSEWPDLQRRLKLIDIDPADLLKELVNSKR
ncbi:MAG: GntR family transcriptional regulator [Pseudomonadota bacterium]